MLSWQRLPIEVSDTDAPEWPAGLASRCGGGCSSARRFLSNQVTESMLTGLKLCISSLLCCASAAFGADLLIANVTVVSPEQAQPLPNRHVLIRNGRIVSVSRQSAAAVEAQRIDGRGKFLVPGLMDSHVHVGTPPGLPLFSNDPSLAVLHEAYMHQQPRSYLYFGVTQLLDLIGPPQGIATFEAQPQRPDLFKCGAAVVLDGYPAALIDVLLSANPLETLRAWDSIESIVLHGKVIRRETLAANVDRAN